MKDTYSQDFESPVIFRQDEDIDLPVYNPLKYTDTDFKLLIDIPSDKGEFK